MATQYINILKYDGKHIYIRPGDDVELLNLDKVEVEVKNGDVVFKISGGESIIAVNLAVLAFSDVAEDVKINGIALNKFFFEQLNINDTVLFTSDEEKDTVVLGDQASVTSDSPAGEGLLTSQLASNLNNLKRMRTANIEVPTDSSVINPGTETDEYIMRTLFNPTQFKDDVPTDFTSIDVHSYYDRGDSVLPKKSYIVPLNFAMKYGNAAVASGSNVEMYRGGGSLTETDGIGFENTRQSINLDEYAGTSAGVNITLLSDKIYRTLELSVTKPGVIIKSFTITGFVSSVDGSGEVTKIFGADGVSFDGAVNSKLIGSKMTGSLNASQSIAQAQFNYDAALLQSAEVTEMVLTARFIGQDAVTGDFYTGRSSIAVNFTDDPQEGNGAFEYSYYMGGRTIRGSTQADVLNIGQYVMNKPIDMIELFAGEDVINLNGGDRVTVFAGAGVDTVNVSGLMHATNNWRLDDGLGIYAGASEDEPLDEDDTINVKKGVVEEELIITLDPDTLLMQLANEDSSLKTQFYGFSALKFEQQEVGLKIQVNITGNDLENLGKMVAIESQALESNETAVNLDINSNVLLRSSDLSILKQGDGGDETGYKFTGSAFSDFNVSKNVVFKLYQNGYGRIDSVQLDGESASIQYDASSITSTTVINYIVNTNKELTISDNNGDFVTNSAIAGLKGVNIEANFNGLSFDSFIDAFQSLSIKPSIEYSANLDLTLPSPGTAEKTLHLNLTDTTKNDIEANTLSVDRGVLFSIIGDSGSTVNLNLNSNTEVYLDISKSVTINTSGDDSVNIGLHSEDSTNSVEVTEDTVKIGNNVSVSKDYNINLTIYTGENDDTFSFTSSALPVGNLILQDSTVVDNDIVDLDNLGLLDVIEVGESYNFEQPDGGSLSLSIINIERVKLESIEELQGRLSAEANLPLIEAGSISDIRAIFDGSGADIVDFIDIFGNNLTQVTMSGGNSVENVYVQFTEESSAIMLLDYKATGVEGIPDIIKSSNQGITGEYDSNIDKQNKEVQIVSNSEELVFKSTEAGNSLSDATNDMKVNNFYNYNIQQVKTLSMDLGVTPVENNETIIKNTTDLSAVSVNATSSGNDTTTVIVNSSDEEGANDITVSNGNFTSLLTVGGQVLTTLTIMGQNINLSISSDYLNDSSNVDVTNYIAVGANASVTFESDDGAGVDVWDPSVISTLLSTSLNGFTQVGFTDQSDSVTLNDKGFYLSEVTHYDFRGDVDKLSIRVTPGSSKKLAKGDSEGYFAYEDLSITNGVIKAIANLEVLQLVNTNSTDSTTIVIDEGILEAVSDLTVAFSNKNFTVEFDEATTYGKDFKLEIGEDGFTFKDKDASESKILEISDFGYIDIEGRIQFDAEDELVFKGSTSDTTNSLLNLTDVTFAMGDDSKIKFTDVNYLDYRLVADIQIDTNANTGGKEPILEFGRAVTITEYDPTSTTMYRFQFHEISSMDVKNPVGFENIILDSIENENGYRLNVTSGNDDNTLQVIASDYVTIESSSSPFTTSNIGGRRSAIESAVRFEIKDVALDTSNFGITNTDIGAYVDISDTRMSYGYGGTASLQLDVTNVDTFLSSAILRVSDNTQHFDYHISAAGIFAGLTSDQNLQIESFNGTVYFDGLSIYEVKISDNTILTNDNAQSGAWVLVSDLSVDYSNSSVEVFTVAIPTTVTANQKSLNEQTVPTSITDINIDIIPGPTNGNLLIKNLGGFAGGYYNNTNEYNITTIANPSLTISLSSSQATTVNDATFINYTTSEFLSTNDGLLSGLGFQQSQSDIFFLSSSLIFNNATLVSSDINFSANNVVFTNITNSVISNDDEDHNLMDANQFSSVLSININIDALRGHFRGTVNSIYIGQTAVAGYNIADITDTTPATSERAIIDSYDNLDDGVSTDLRVANSTASGTTDLLIKSSYIKQTDGSDITTFIGNLASIDYSSFQGNFSIALDFTDTTTKSNVVYSFEGDHNIAVSSYDFNGVAELDENAALSQTTVTAAAGPTYQFIYDENLNNTGSIMPDVGPALLNKMTLKYSEDNKSGVFFNSDFVRSNIAEVISLASESVDIQLKDTSSSTPNAINLSEITNLLDYNSINVTDSSVDLSVDFSSITIINTTVVVSDIVNMNFISSGTVTASGGDNLFANSSNTNISSLAISGGDVTSNTLLSDPKMGFNYTVYNSDNEEATIGGYDSVKEGIFAPIQNNTAYTGYYFDLHDSSMMKESSSITQRTYTILTQGLTSVVDLQEASFRTPEVATEDPGSPVENAVPELDFKSNSSNIFVTTSLSTATNASLGLFYASVQNNDLKYQEQPTNATMAVLGYTQNAPTFNNDDPLAIVATLVIRVDSMPAQITVDGKALGDSRNVSTKKHDGGLYITSYNIESSILKIDDSFDVVDIAELSADGIQWEDNYASIQIEDNLSTLTLFHDDSFSNLHHDVSVILTHTVTSIELGSNIDLDIDFIEKSFVATQFVTSAIFKLDEVYDNADDLVIGAQHDNLIQLHIDNSYSSDNLLQLSSDRGVNDYSTKDIFNIDDSNTIDSIDISNTQLSIANVLSYQSINNISAELNFMNNPSDINVNVNIEGGMLLDLKYHNSVSNLNLKITNSSDAKFVVNSNSIGLVKEDIDAAINLYYENIQHIQLQGLQDDDNIIFDIRDLDGVDALQNVFNQVDDKHNVELNISNLNNHNSISVYSSHDSSVSTTLKIDDIDINITNNSTSPSAKLQYNVVDNSSSNGDELFFNITTIKNFKYSSDMLTEDDDKTSSHSQDSGYLSTFYKTSSLDNIQLNTFNDFRADNWAFANVHTVHNYMASDSTLETVINSLSYSIDNSLNIDSNYNELYSAYKLEGRLGSLHYSNLENDNIDLVQDYQSIDMSLLRYNSSFVNFSEINGNQAVGINFNQGVVNSTFNLDINDGSDNLEFGGGINGGQLVSTNGSSLRYWKTDINMDLSSNYGDMDVNLLSINNQNSSLSGVTNIVSNSNVNNIGGLSGVIKFGSDSAEIAMPITQVGEYQFVHGASLNLKGFNENANSAYLHGNELSEQFLAVENSMISGFAFEQSRAALLDITGFANFTEGNDEHDVDLGVHTVGNERDAALMHDAYYITFGSNQYDISNINNHNSGYNNEQSMVFGRSKLDGAMMYDYTSIMSMAYRPTDVNYEDNYNWGDDSMTGFSSQYFAYNDHTYNSHVGQLGDDKDSVRSVIARFDNLSHASDLNLIAPGNVAFTKFFTHAEISQAGSNDLTNKISFTGSMNGFNSVNLLVHNGYSQDGETVSLLSNSFVEHLDIFASSAESNNSLVHVENMHISDGSNSNIITDLNFKYTNSFISNFQFRDVSLDNLSYLRELYDANMNVEDTSALDIKHIKAGSTVNQGYVITLDSTSINNSEDFDIDDIDDAIQHELSEQYTQHDNLSMAQSHSGSGFVLGLALATMPKSLDVIGASSGDNVTDCSISSTMQDYLRNSTLTQIQVLTDGFDDYAAQLDGALQPSVMSTIIGADGDLTFTAATDIIHYDGKIFRSTIDDFNSNAINHEFMDSGYAGLYNISAYSNDDSGTASYSLLSLAGRYSLIDGGAGEDTFDIYYGHSSEELEPMFINPIESLHDRSDAESTDNIVMGNMLVMMNDSIYKDYSSSDSSSFLSSINQDNLSNDSSVFMGAYYSNIKSEDGSIDLSNDDNVNLKDNPYNFSYKVNSTDFMGMGSKMTTLNNIESYKLSGFNDTAVQFMSNNSNSYYDTPDIDLGYEYNSNKDFDTIDETSLLAVNNMHDAVYLNSSLNGSANSEGNVSMNADGTVNRPDMPFFDITLSSLHNFEVSTFSRVLNNQDGFSIDSDYVRDNQGSSIASYENTSNTAYHNAYSFYNYTSASNIFPVMSDNIAVAVVDAYNQYTNNNSTDIKGMISTLLSVDALEDHSLEDNGFIRAKYDDNNVKVGYETTELAGIYRNIGTLMGSDDQANNQYFNYITNTLGVNSEVLSTFNSLSGIEREGSADDFASAANELLNYNNTNLLSKLASSGLYSNDGVNEYRQAGDLLYHRGAAGVHLDSNLLSNSDSSGTQVFYGVDTVYYSSSSASFNMDDAEISVMSLDDNSIAYSFLLHDKYDPSHSLNLVLVLDETNSLAYSQGMPFLVDTDLFYGVMEYDEDDNTSSIYTLEIESTQLTEELLIDSYTSGDNAEVAELELEAAELKEDTNAAHLDKVDSLISEGMDDNADVVDSTEEAQLYIDEDILNDQDSEELILNDVNEDEHNDISGGEMEYSDDHSNEEFDISDSISFNSLFDYNSDHSQDENYEDTSILYSAIDSSSIEESLIMQDVNESMSYAMEYSDNNDSSDASQSYLLDNHHHKYDK